MAGMLVGFTDFSTSMAPSFLLSLLLSSSSSSSMAVQMGEKAAARVGVGRRRRRRAHALVGGDDADGGKGSGAAAQIGEKAAARASGDGGDVRVRCCRRCHRWGEGSGVRVRRVTAVTCACVAGGSAADGGKGSGTRVRRAAAPAWSPLSSPFSPCSLWSQTTERTCGWTSRGKTVQKKIISVKNLLQMQQTLKMAFERISF